MDKYLVKEKLEKMLDKLPKETWNDKVFYDDCEKAVKEVCLCYENIDYKQKELIVENDKYRMIIGALVTRLLYPKQNDMYDDCDSIKEISCAQNMLVEADIDKIDEFICEYFGFEQDEEDCF